MSYSYSNDPNNSELDNYRFLIGDTGWAFEELEATPASTDFILHDEEIQFVLDTYTANNTRLYYLFNGMANKLAKDIKKKLGPSSEEPETRIEFFKAKAKEYKKLMSMASGLSVPEHITTGKTFNRCMHDNSSASYPEDDDDA